MSLAARCCRSPEAFGQRVLRHSATHTHSRCRSVFFRELAVDAFNHSTSYSVGVFACLAPILEGRMSTASSPPLPVTRYLAWRSQPQPRWRLVFRPLLDQDLLLVPRGALDEAPSVDGKEDLDGLDTIKSRARPRASKRTGPSFGSNWRPPGRMRLRAFRATDSVGGRVGE
jgi:hypothetical protein